MREQVIDVTSYAVLASKEVSKPNAFVSGLLNLVGHKPDRKFELQVKFGHKATTSIGPTRKIITADGIEWEVMNSVSPICTIAKGIAYNENPNVIGKAVVK